MRQSPNDMRRERLYGICQLAGWSLYTIIINVRYAPRAGSREMLLWQVIDLTLVCGIGLLLTHLFHLYIKRSGWVHLPLHSLIPRIITSCLALAIVWQLLELIYL